MTLSRTQKILFGAAGFLAALIVLLAVGAWLRPSMTEFKLEASDFRPDRDGQLMRHRISKSFQKWTDKGLPLRLWQNGAPLGDADAFSDLDAPGPFYLIKDDAFLYANSAMYRIISDPGAVVVLRADNRLAASRIIPPLGGALMVLTALGLLAVFASPAARHLPHSPHRRHALDSLRGLAALCVAALHALGTFYPVSWFNFTYKDGHLISAPPLVEWFKMSPLELVLAGKVMVATFWILSGLVLSLPLLGAASYNKLGQAAAKRYFRLMPLAALTTLASYVFAASGAYPDYAFSHLVQFQTGNHLVHDYTGHMDFFTAWCDALLLGHQLNAPLWTISLEFWGSLLLFGILGCTVALKQRRLLWLCCIIYLAQVVREPAYVDFILGLFLAEVLVIRGHNADQLIKPIPAILIFVLAVLMGSAYPGWLNHAKNGLSGELDAWLVRGSAFGFVALAALSRPVIRILTWKPLIWLGERSFAFYAVHSLMIHLPGRIAAVQLMQIGVPVMVACSLGLLTSLAATMVAADYLFKHVDRPSTALANIVGRWFAGIPGVGKTATSSEPVPTITHAISARDVSQPPPPSQEVRTDRAW